MYEDDRTSYDLEEVRGKVRDLIVARLNINDTEGVPIKYGTRTTTTTCGEDTCVDWWDDFVILVDGEVVYETNQRESPFAELQDWLEGTDEA